MVTRKLLKDKRVLCGLGVVVGIFPGLAVTLPLLALPVAAAAGAGWLTYRGLKAGTRGLAHVARLARDRLQRPPEEQPPDRAAQLREQLHQAKADYEKKLGLLRSLGLDAAEAGKIPMHLRRKFIQRIHQLLG